VVYDSRRHPRSFDHCIAVPNCPLGIFQVLHTHQAHFTNSANHFSSPIIHLDLLVSHHNHFLQRFLFRNFDMAIWLLALSSCNIGNFHVHVVTTPCSANQVYECRIRKYVLTAEKHRLALHIVRYSGYTVDLLSVHLSIRQRPIWHRVDRTQSSCARSPAAMQSHIQRQLDTFNFPTTQEPVG